MPTSPARIASVMDPGAAAIVDVYVEAMLQLAADDGQAEEIASELQQIVQVIAETDGLEELLAGGGLSSKRQSLLVEQVFTGRCSRQVEGLLAVLAHNGRLGLLRQVADRFRRRLDRRQGKVEVDVVTAVEMDAAAMQAVTDALKELTGASPLVRAHVDPSLIGGVVVRIGDRQYDASVAGALKDLRGKLALALAETMSRLSEREHETQR